MMVTPTAARDTAAEPEHAPDPGDGSGAVASRFGQLVPRAVAALGVWAAGMFSLYREVLTSGFTQLQGDNGDQRLLVYINEWWLTVLKGRGGWRHPAFFFPAPGVLGYSDALVLYQPVYAPLRLAGADPFLAYQLTLMALTTIGFTGAAVFLRRVVGARLAVSLLGAALFAFSSGLGVKVGHSQLFAVNLLPVLGLLVANMLRCLPQRPVRAAASGAAAGLLQALLLLTSFYIGWFTLLAGAVVLVCCAVAAGPVLLERARVTVASWRATAATACATASGFAVGITPFLATYLPVSTMSGGRSIEEVASHAPGPGDLVNVGSRNLVWGRVLQAVGLDGRDDVELALAVTPSVVAVAVVGTVLLWRASRRRGEDRARARVVAGVAAGGLVLLLLPVRIGDTSAWTVVWSLVPGAQAIRAPARLDIVTNAVFVVVLAVVLDAALTAWSSHGPRAVRAGAAGLWVLALVLFAEQVQTGHNVNLSHASELDRVASLAPAPAGCRAFFVVDSPAGSSYYAPQIDAMLISLTTGIPTLNGYSGMSPPGWSLDVTSPDYAVRVERWLQDHGLDSGVCGYDLRTRAWSTDPLSPAPHAGST